MGTRIGTGRPLPETEKPSKGGAAVMPSGVSVTDYVSSTDTATVADAPKDAPRSPKTSPSPKLGMTVIYRTQQKDKQFNSTSDHVAIITRVFSKCVNLKVLPDCGEPYDATSQKRIAYQDEEGTGWFTVDEA